MHLNYTGESTICFGKWSGGGGRGEGRKPAKPFWNILGGGAVSTHVVTQIYRKTNRTTEAAGSGSLPFTLHWPKYPPGTAPTPFCEWYRLPYGWRHWTSCTTLGDMCPGDRPILTPPGLCQLCSVCAEAPKSPSGCYFWVQTKRKITVKRILWLAYLLLSSRNSFPKERLSSLFTQAEMTSWNTY